MRLEKLKYKGFKWVVRLRRVPGIKQDIEQFESAIRTAKRLGVKYLMGYFGTSPSNVVHFRTKKDAVTFMLVYHEA